MLGKTIQTLALLLHDKETSDEKPTVLLVCPMSVIGSGKRRRSRLTSRSLSITAGAAPGQKRCARRA